MSLDPLNILLLAVALVVFWRLRAVLGTRTGNERPPVDPIGGRADDSQQDQPKTGKVLRFPPSAESETPRPQETEAMPPAWTGLAEPGSALANGLDQIMARDSSFVPRSFVEGAKLAYEMIIEAYAKGDKAALKNLLSKDVFDGFAAAIDKREAAGQRVDQRFVGISSAKLLSASLSGNMAAVTLEFISELISATLSKAGDVVDGDSREIREVTDVWTFERDVTSRNPNWKLVSTQASG